MANTGPQPLNRFTHGGSQPTAGTTPARRAHEMGHSLDESIRGGDAFDW